MNEQMSILLATTILALGGLGLYMYKSSDEKQKGSEDDYNEDSIFGGNFWGTSNDDNNDDNNDNNDDEILDEYIEEEDYKPRRKNTKTQRNRKLKGTSRRRY